MKPIYTLLFVIASIVSNAQIINIPDANFKAKLLDTNLLNRIASAEEPNENWMVNTFITVDSNSDGEIQLSEAQAIKFLDVSYGEISSLAGIENFTNLKVLACDVNELSTLDISSLINLKLVTCNDNSITSFTINNLSNLQVLGCRNNNLTSLDVSNLDNLIELGCSYNPLGTLNVSNLPNLVYLECHNNNLTLLNLSGSRNIEFVDCNNNFLTALDLSEQINMVDLECGNNQLFTLNVKNGIPEESILISPNPNLRYICADEIEMPYIQSLIQQFQLLLCHVNTYCSFRPGGRFFTINGSNHVDYNNNGCDSNDLNFPNLNMSITDGTISGNIISNDSGQFTLNLIPGDYTITPMLENPGYFNVSPTNLQVNFPSQSPLTQDFCIIPNGLHQDIEAWIMPITPARPGFESSYKIFYKNKGNVPVSGNITFSFEDNFMTFVLANPTQNNQSSNQLGWNYANLLPFEIREIEVRFLINTPTTEIYPINVGDRLKFQTLIYPNSNDEHVADNYNSITQIVVGSFDPNDKTCLEGNTITPEMVGQYVHYIIRFENTGTFAAENIVVKDIIDTTKFDINSLVPLHSSHDFVTKISEVNKVEFIFENINLPFDDANNDGYVAFKIKTKPTLVVGNTFSNTASIYFDYNFPIVTDPATTVIQALANADFEFGNYFSIYPNPAATVLNLQTKAMIGVKSIDVYNMLGQLVIAIPNAENVTSIDVSDLNTGTYFIKVNTDNGTANTKFVKE